MCRGIGFKNSATRMSLDSLVKTCLIPRFHLLLSLPFKIFRHVRHSYHNVPFSRNYAWRGCHPALVPGISVGPMSSSSSVCSKVCSAICSGAGAVLDGSPEVASTSDAASGVGSVPVRSSAPSGMGSGAGPWKLPSRLRPMSALRPAQPSGPCLCRESVVARLNVRRQISHLCGRSPV